MRKKPTIQILVILVLLVTSGGLLGPTGSAQRQDAIVIPQPSDWVPFSAELTKTHNDGRVTVGRFYRARDGSTRSETGRSLDQITAIMIKNVPQARYYSWGSRRGWTTNPMDMPPHGWRPQQRLAHGYELSPRKIEGYEVTVKESTHSVMFEAPHLNFFPLLVKEKKCDGGRECGYRHSNIKVGEQPAELFLPQEGQIVLRRNEPRGIVRVR